uniref:calmodulin-lysine N-methyltransferase-like n=1 Tax=Styela clava TaxID=7725 RepID=UPI001939B4A4|nr:calmodulin-lysine N-methyltransferase-like [Styela clava]
MDPIKRKNLAKYRWLILRKALLGRRTSDVPSKGSIRVHNSVALFHITETRNGDLESWMDYKHDGTPPLTVQIKRSLSILSMEDLIEGDNTGNVCIWASEQVMARYCVVNMKQFYNKSVIEIGGGSSCLAGLFIAKYGNASRVVLSDGNNKAITNVDSIIRKNFCNKMDNLKIPEAVQIEWDNEEVLVQYAAQFDFLFCADCLFRDDIRRHLALAIFRLLTSEGEAIIFAPRRGNSMNDFLKLAKELFGISGVSIIQKYDEKVWQFHLSNLNVSSYNEDIHYPYLIKLTKSLKNPSLLTAASSA